MRNISFCNNIAYIITDIELKKQLLKCVYDNINLKKFQYKFLKDDDINIIKEQKYNVLINNIGNKNLLIFTKYNNENYSFFVDKKTLSYEYNDLDFNKAKLFIVKLRVNIYFYENTFLDGDLIKKFDNKWFYQINDVYLFMGKSWLEQTLQDKLFKMKSFLDKYYISDDFIEPCSLELANIYAINEMENVVTTIVDTHNYVTNGLLFMPQISGTKIIYLFKSQEEKEQQIIEPIHKSIVKKNIIPVNKNISLTFRMNKNKKLPDTYNLLLLDNEELVEIGIAYIPTLNCSQWVKQLFKKSNGKDIYMYCKYIEKFNKWKPIKISTIDKLNDIKTFL